MSPSSFRGLGIMANLWHWTPDCLNSISIGIDISSNNSSCNCKNREGAARLWSRSTLLKSNAANMCNTCTDQSTFPRFWALLEKLLKWSMNVYICSGKESQNLSCRAILRYLVTFIRFHLKAERTVLLAQASPCSNSRCNQSCEQFDFAAQISAPKHTSS